MSLILHRGKFARYRLNRGRIRPVKFIFHIITPPVFPYFTKYPDKCQSEKIWLSHPSLIKALVENILETINFLRVQVRPVIIHTKNTPIITIGMNFIFYVLFSLSLPMRLRKLSYIRCKYRRLRNIS